MQTEYTARELSELIGISIPAIHKKAIKLGWEYQSKPNPHGGGVIKCYQSSTLDEQTRLLINKKQYASSPAPSGNQVPATTQSHVPVESLTEQQLCRATAKTDLLLHYIRTLNNAGWGKKSQARENFIAAYNTGFAFPELYKILGEVSWKTV